MAHDASIIQELTRFRSEEVGWEVVDYVGGGRGKVIGMGVQRHTGEEEYGK